MIAEPDLSSLDDEKLAALYAWPSDASLRLNMLLGPSGSTSGEDGTSHSITSPLDRRVLRLIRAEADAVIVGASSVRAEGWYLPPTGLLIVLTESGTLPWETCPDRNRVVTCATVTALANWLREHPGRNLCEGGLATARALDSAVGFDEIALTAHLPADEALARVTQTPNNFILAHATRASRPVGTGSEVFFLWRRAEPLKE